MRAVFASTLAFASAGYWGMYFLTRKRFCLSTYAAICGAVVFMFNGFFAAHDRIIEDRSYYYFHGVDPAPVLASYRALASGEGKPQITDNALVQQPDGTHFQDNSLMARGYSNLFCYNALYGYSLEHFQVEPLAVGPVLSSQKPGLLNLRNPACLLYPEENDCRLWDSFTTAELDKARAFAAYLPFEFKRSTLQHVADTLTEGALALVLAYAAWALAQRWRRRNHDRSSAH